MIRPEIVRQVFTEEDWAIFVGALQIARSQGTEFWMHQDEDRKYECMLSAANDPDDVISASPAFAGNSDEMATISSPSGEQHNAGPWSVAVIPLFDPSRDVTDGKNFRQFRGTIQAVTRPLFAINEANQEIAVFPGYIKGAEIIDEVIALNLLKGSLITLSSMVMRHNRH